MSTCTTVSRELDEPLAATAAEARTWLLLEQPGPWGARALTASHLDPGLGRALETRADGTGVRIALIRRPGRHADRGAARGRQLIVAHADPAASWVRRAELADPRTLLDLDFVALGSGDHGGLGREHGGDPMALVCTNGKRDRCCALRGRPLASDLHAMGGVEVWEITHLGGHRFSPTMLVLPCGYTYGRLGVQDAKDVLETARNGRMITRGCRGRTAWGRPGQAAELAVRELSGEDLADALTVERVRPTDMYSTNEAGCADKVSCAATGTGTGTVRGWTVCVRHVDGRSWSVAVREEAQAPARPESCGAAVGTPTRVVATAVTPLP